jgi:tetratricopeptide (TPR) repeat protein
VHSQPSCRLIGNLAIAIALALAVGALADDELKSKRLASDWGDRAKRLNERYVRISKEYLRLMQRGTELRQSYQQIERDLDKLRVTATLRKIQATFVEDQLDSEVQQARSTVSKKRSGPNRGRSAANLGLTVSAAAHEAQLQNINNYIQQLDTVSQVAVRRLADVIRQLIELSKSAEALQTDQDALQNDYWSITDAQGRLSHDELRALLDGMVPLPEDCAAAYVARAFARRRIGRIEEAGQDLDSAVALGGAYTPVALAAKGEYLVATGKSREGWQEFAKIKRVGKPDARVTWLRAQSLAADGKMSAAESGWKQVLQSGSYDAVAHWALALLYGAPPTGRPVDATKALEHARAAGDLTSNEDWMCLDALAIAYAADNNFDEAIMYARQAAEVAQSEKRILCLEHVKKFEAKQRVTWDWK